MNLRCLFGHRRGLRGRATVEGIPDTPVYHCARPGCRAVVVRLFTDPRPVQPVDARHRMPAREQQELRHRAVRLLRTIRISKERTHLRGIDGAVPPSPAPAEDMTDKQERELAQQFGVDLSTPAPASETPEPLKISETFLRGVVSSTTSYSAGWREVCARLLWAEQRIENTRRRACGGDGHF